MKCKLHDTDMTDTVPNKAGTDKGPDVPLVFTFPLIQNTRDNKASKTTPEGSMGQTQNVELPMVRLSFSFLIFFFRQVLTM